MRVCYNAYFRGLAWGLTHSTTAHHALEPPEAGRLSGPETDRGRWSKFSRNPGRRCGVFMRGGDMRFVSDIGRWGTSGTRCSAHQPPLRTLRCPFREEYWTTSHRFLTAWNTPPSSFKPHRAGCSCFPSWWLIAGFGVNNCCMKEREEVKSAVQLQICAFPKRTHRRSRDQKHCKNLHRLLP